MAAFLKPDAGLLVPIFLREAASHKFEFGQWDCVITLANWLRFQLDDDPAIDIRGTYSNIRGWKEVVKKEGGMISFVGGRAHRVGLREIEGDPKIGDIGLIRIKRSQGYWVGAIRGSTKWWFKISDGITATELPASRIWGV